MPRFYLTTAIDYANGDPHLGHALEKIGADAICRFHRQLGRRRLVPDRHGRARAEGGADGRRRGMEPQAFVDRVAGRFQAMWATLGISHDQFMRTTRRAHHRRRAGPPRADLHAQPRRLLRATYTGMYCVGCESFKQPADIADGRCALHPTRTLEEITERNWFFRLSRTPSGSRRTSPRTRVPRAGVAPQRDPRPARPGARGHLGQPRALRVGRALPAPPRRRRDADHLRLVRRAPQLLDRAGFPGSEAGWPAQLHVIGKDITRFHAVIWPAMLMAAGLPLPERVWAHGFVSLGGERFSKSAGVKLDLAEAIDRFGPDAFRYFLLREVPFDGDGAFSWERFEAVHRRARQRARQPRQPHHGHDREVLRTAWSRRGPR
jgi:methionyl-tRNA synthetase